MCGIIGYTGSQDAVPIIIEGLRRLEYRGYDSAGIASVSKGKLSITRCKGKIADLEQELRGAKLTTTTAIGHTRWATHGKPSVENAHPHRSGKIALVHNGIIENYFELKHTLQSEGVKFSSETDTEVLAHLINKSLSPGMPLEKAVLTALSHVRGAYAIAVISEEEPGKVVAFRKDSPLVAGIAEGEYFVASDIPAFLSHCRNVVFMEDNEMVVMDPKGVRFLGLGGAVLTKKTVAIEWSIAMAEKGGFKHFMLKEIFEQPRALADTITGRLTDDNAGINVEEFGLSREKLASVKRIIIAACGTSWHAALVGKYMIEELARIPVEVDIASEFRYRRPIFREGDLFISITQSGETADTLAAQRLAKSKGTPTMNICNVVGSTTSREASAVFYTRSGPEIGVASTKAFTAQIMALFLFAVALSKAHDTVSDEESAELIRHALEIPELVEAVLSGNANMEAVARELHLKKAVLFLGRGINFPIALEGALKLKEISYIHAEGYPAGEMKHGPIALIDEGYPVVFLAPRDELYEKVVSNIQEIKSRGGRIILITEEGKDGARALADYVFEVPKASRLLSPLLLVIPLQLLAYHIGVLLGCDVDQPRNLAKSVTVE